MRRFFLVLFLSFISAYSYIVAQGPPPTTGGPPPTTGGLAECEAIHCGCVAPAALDGACNESPTEWTWACYDAAVGATSWNNGCFELKPPACDNTVNLGCTNGNAVAADPASTDVPVPGADALIIVPDATRKYNWTCNVDGLPGDPCELQVDLCGGIEMQTGQQCCSGKILQQDETCCYVGADAVQAARAMQGVDGSFMDNGGLIAPNNNAMICTSPNKCFVRRLCQDGNQETHGERGDQTVKCGYELKCAVAIMHSCNSGRINNNCRDECHPTINPRPEWCDGGGGITGTCGGAFGTCATGWPFEINPFIWWCLGDNNNSNFDDAECKTGGVGKCGATYNTCTPGTPEIIDATNWKCLGTDTNSTLDDALCGNVVDGVCGDLPGSCADGEPDPNNPIVDNAAGIQWNCLGENGGSDATCEIKNGVCGTSPYPANIYECDFSVPTGVPAITPPGFTNNTFEWSCLGEEYGIDKSCTYTCPLGQVIDADLLTCVPEPPDLCLNIADNQNPVPVGMTRFPSGNCCTDPQVWDTTTNACVNPLTVSCGGAPDPAGIGQAVAWTSTVTGGIATKTYTWSGTDTLTGNTANTSKTYATTGAKTANISVTSGSQSLADTCAIQINACSATPPAANSTICTDGPAPATNGAAGVLAAACSNIVSCDWVCGNGFIKKDTLCAPKPDLTAAAPTPNIATINIAQNFSALISNVDGPTEVGFNNFFQISPDSNFLVDVTNKAPTAMAALAAGGTNTTMTSHTFTAVGTYYIRACADKSNPLDVGGIDESNELNNCGAETIVVVSEAPALPTIDTPTDTDVTSASATLGATVTSVGIPSSLLRRGVCWGTNINPSVNYDGSPAVGTLGCQAEEPPATTGIFAVPVSGLSPETTYYYRGYAQNATGIAYTGSTVTTITTPPGPSGSITATNCMIPVGFSSCDTALTWTTQNLIPGKDTAVTTPGRSDISAATSGTNVPAFVTYGSRNFYLYHNAVELDSATATAECVLGSRWNSTLCELVSCPEGTTYVADSTKPAKCCTAAEIATNTDQCGSTVVCDNDGICETGEGCLCPDCLTEQDSCEPGLECSGTGGDGACCPAGTTWNTITNSCITNVVPTVISPTYTDINSASVILGANVTSLGIPSLITNEAQGTCYGPTANPGLGGADSICLSEGITRIGVFTHLRSGLSPETTYHYRGYATNSFGTGYSPDDTFITPPGPSGTLTATNCTIPIGSSSCDTLLTWTTQDLTAAATAVTTPTNITVSTDTSGTDVVYSISYDDTPFFLYHNGAELANATATATCASGSIWDLDSMTCLGPTPPTIDLPTATNIKSASATLGARVTSIGSPPPLFQRGVCWSLSSNPLLGVAGSTCRAEGQLITGVFTVDVTGLSPGTTYYYRGFAQNATGIAYTGGAASTFTPPIGPWGDIGASPMVCKILAGRSSCTTALTWTTTDTTGAVAVTTPGRPDVGTTTSGTNVSASIDYDSSGNGRNFFLYHMGDKLDEVNVQAECNTGSSWDSSICFDPIADPSGILTATDCEILENQSTCLTSLDWDTVNLTAAATAVTTTPPDNTVVSNNTTDTNIPYTVEYGSKNFFLYHNTVRLAMATATATCENTTGWDTNISQCKKYTLAYRRNGADVTGDVPTTQFLTYIPGADIIISDEGTGSTKLAKPGYGFDGWNTVPDGTGVAYAAGDTLTITTNTTLYAQWKTNVFTITVIGDGTITSEDGNIKCPLPGPCAFDYPNGAPVKLTAVLGGATKIMWLGCDAVSGLNGEICDIAVNSDTTITAIFTGPRDGCFADSTTAINLDNYILGPNGTNGLVARINSCNLGYGFTDPAREAQTKSFRTKLAGNINKYITSRYCPTKIVANMIWNANYITDPALIDPIFGDCGDNNLDENSNGYFYYENIESLPDALLTVGDPTQTSATALVIDRPTVLYVVGADVYIHNDITYSGVSGKYPSLVIIVQKDSAGNGGDIYVDPGVTKINATLIADGSLTNGEGNSPKNWIFNPTELENPLLINGRLLTYNLRGGSLNASLLPRGNGSYVGNLLGICAGNSTTPVQGSSGEAASQDLERFRWVLIGGDTQCSLYVTDNVPARKPDILTTLTE